MQQSPTSLVGKRVLIALTGRIDSAVAAFLLKKQGMDVLGVTFVLQDQPKSIAPENLPKCFISDLEKVKSFCDQLKIPFYAIDAKAKFENDVIEPFVANKILAQASNTCVDCNRIRLEIMYQKMKKLGAEYIATGHFAKIYKNINADEYFIHSNSDVNSDQSFLLAGVSKEVLKHLILPLGELKKNEVEKISKNFAFQVEKSSTRVDFCFQERAENFYITDFKIPESMKKKGPVINVNNGFFYGEHDGIFHYYLAQKNLQFQGVTAAVDKEMIVIGYRKENQALELGAPQNLTFKGAFLTNVSLSPSLDRKKPLTVFIKIQHSQTMYKADLYFRNNSALQLDFHEPVYPILPDEYVVIYDKSGGNAKLMGIGKVSGRGAFKPIDRAQEFRTPNESQNVISSDLFHF